jgi:hypothetical protein
LNKTIVLVLNRNWQAINIRTPADAFCQMATNVATARDIELRDSATPEGARAEALRPREVGRVDHAARPQTRRVASLALGYCLPGLRPLNGARSLRDKI